MPIEKWHKPDLAPAYLVEKKQKEKQKRSCNNNQTKKKSGETIQAGFATRATIINEESVGVGSFAQTATVTQEEDEEILDSGSTITLTKERESVENLQQCKHKIIMSTNVGEQRIHEEGQWKE